MKIETIRILLLCLYIASMQSVFAQQNLTNHLVLNIDDDLWSYNYDTDDLQQLTTWGYNGIPVRSPHMNNGYIAYTSASERYVNSDQTLYAGHVPTNIWILNLQNNSFRRIADQPTNTDTIRSVPDWSPDGTSLAWIELDVNPENYSLSDARLVAYNININQRNVIATNLDLGMQDGGLSMPRITWGQDGIMRIVTVSAGDGSRFSERLEIYSPDDNSVRTFEVLNESMSDNNREAILDYMWATEDGTPYIVMYFRNAGWQRVNPDNGTRSLLSAPPVLRTDLSSSSTILQPVFSGDQEMIRWQWQLEQFDGTPLGDSSIILYETDTLADWNLPALLNSNEIAWADRQIIRLWQSGQVIRELGRSSNVNHASVVGLPMQWYMADSLPVSTPTPLIPTPTPLPVNQCPPHHPSIFEANELVQISGGTPNNIRDLPSTDGQIVDVLPSGTVLSIIRGPVCADGYNWYNIRHENTVGWTAEGNDTEYWLLPVSQSGGDTGEVDGAGSSQPVIVNFAASLDSARPGDQVTLTWEVQNVDSNWHVYIYEWLIKEYIGSKNGVNVSSSGTITITLHHPTTSIYGFTLLVRNTNDYSNVISTQLDIPRISD